MPALEMAQETGKLVAWLKKEGEHVRKGEMLLEVETDKAVVEIEAAGDGILAGVTAQTGRRGSSWPHDRLAAAARRDAAADECRSRIRADDVFTSRIRQRDARRSRARRRRCAPSPKARRLAQEHGVDIASLKGSGPGGEILADDILAAGEGPA